MSDYSKKRCEGETYFVGDVVKDVGHISQMRGREHRVKKLSLTLVLVTERSEYARSKKHSKITSMEITVGHETR